MKGYVFEDAGGSCFQIYRVAVWCRVGFRGRSQTGDKQHGIPWSIIEGLPEHYPYVSRSSGEPDECSMCGESADQTYHLELLNREGDTKHLEPSLCTICANAVGEKDWVTVTPMTAPRQEHQSED